MPHQHRMTAEMERCIQYCMDCVNMCEQTLTHCLTMGGKHASAAHMSTMMDCAEVCGTTAKLMLRSSQFHQRMCEICAEICDACARDCERLADGDETMLECADVCRTCAESCRQMASERSRTAGPIRRRTPTRGMHLQH
jgi:hypothetical protein